MSPKMELRSFGERHVQLSKVEEKDYKCRPYDHMGIITPRRERGSSHIGKNVLL